MPMFLAQKKIVPTIASPSQMNSECKICIPAACIESERPAAGAPIFWPFWLKYTKIGIPISDATNTDFITQLKMLSLIRIWARVLASLLALIKLTGWNTILCCCALWIPAGKERYLWALSLSFINGINITGFITRYSTKVNDTKIWCYDLWKSIWKNCCNWVYSWTTADTVSISGFLTLLKITANHDTQSFKHC